MSEQPMLNPWDYKPWWCQPWSILLTSVVLIVLSWVVSKTLWITILVSIPLVIWAGFFLLIWPRLVRDTQTVKLAEDETSNS